jgi:hypothetical protein
MEELRSGRRGVLLKTSTKSPKFRQFLPTAGDN